ncbi:hypothetical protein JHK87_052840 [Glycine soja]|nr:hypothetical protein JHK87_052840 [Glycine soja]
MSKFVIPFESHSPFTDITMFYAGSDSSSKDTNATSPSLMYPRLVLPKAWVPPRVDMVDLVWEDEGENRGRTGGGHVISMQNSITTQFSNLGVVLLQNLQQAQMIMLGVVAPTPVPTQEPPTLKPTPLSIEATPPTQPSPPPQVQD